jgi:predicted amidohydrolase
MKIALASPPFPKSIIEGLIMLEKMVVEATQKHAEIICFP